MSQSMPAESGLEKPVCVFCGSSPGNEPIYASAARSVGRAMAESKIPLVYGGGRRGIMGIVSQAVLESGGYSHGVMPRALVDRQMGGTVGTSTADAGGVPKSGEGRGEDVMDDNDFGGRMTVEVTAGMHERKLKMAQLATGGFIVLPGGYGTFEEALEMITWNQLGIHNLPVIILNINNVFTPLRELFEQSVSAGFIKPDNLSLCTIVDLPGGANDNADISKAEEWGKAAIEAIQAWSPAAGAGYGLKWDTSKDVPIASSSKVKLPPVNFCGTPPPFALFTTLRYTSPSMELATLPVDKSHIPLLGRHLTRLREAHSYFNKRDGDSWGEWPGDEAVWEHLRGKLEEQERKERGDWRVRLMIHSGAVLDVHIVPAPADAGPFTLSFPPHPSLRRRPLVLDPHSTALSSESPEDLDLRRFKTNHRQIYDTASSRGGPSHPEVLLHTDTHVLETATSNIAIQQADGRWVTPRLTHRAVFLDGVARRELLERGLIEEGEVTLEDWEVCKRDGRRVIGFNGLRGVWEAQLS